MESLRPLMILAMVAAVNAAVAFAFSAATEPSGTYYLDFTGGTVDLPRFYPIPTEATLRIPPTRALGRDVRKLVLEAVRRDFSRWPGVRIDEGEAHELVGSNVVLVGGRAPGLLGIANSVDVGDRSPGVAVVFAEGAIEMLTGGLRFVPLDEDMARAIANVASHEIGHLLGFSHIADRSDIMAPGTRPDDPADQAFLHHHQFYVDRTTLWWRCAECTR